MLMATPHGFHEQVDPLLPGETSVALKAMSPGDAAKALAAMPGPCAVLRLMRFDFAHVREILPEMDIEAAVSVLRGFFPGLAAEVLPPAPNTGLFVAEVLRGLGPSVTARILSVVAPAVSSRWFSALLSRDLCDAVEALTAMDPVKAAELCAALNEPRLVQRILGALPRGSATANAVAAAASGAQ
jgi:hypothetical protein